jgi:hypothetical protein
LIVIIDAFRDVIIQLLEAGEDITLGLLSVIEEAIKLFQELLNGEIKIPFISDLFELLGAGKLTILNLSTLMLAIPVTVVHKIAFNEAPFRGVAPLAFPTGPEARLFPTGPEARLTAVASRRAANEEQDENEESQSINAAVIPLGAAALLANLLNGVMLNPLLDLSPDEFEEQRKDLWVVEIVTWVLDILIWIPTIPGAFRPVSSPMEEVLFSFRTIALLLDLGWIIYTGYDVISNGDEDDFTIQRMSRANEVTIIVSSVLGCTDMLFASLWVEDVTGQGADAREQALNASHQLLFAFPRVAGALRLIPDSGAAKLLTATHIVVALATTVTGGILLDNDVAASK